MEEKIQAIRDFDAEIGRWRAEEAAINGFPPLRQVVVDGWTLRFSGSGAKDGAPAAEPDPEPDGTDDGA